MSDKRQKNLCPLQSLHSCTKCQNYLIIPPIFITPNGYICGRCNANSEPIKIRAKAYENLAKLFSYPCKNQQYGCNKYTQFNNVVHESVCNANGFKCPAFTECNEIVRITDIQKHYELKHGDLIIFQKFQISQHQQFTTNKMIILNKKPFILQMCTIKSMECSLVLCYLEKQQNYDKYCVEITSVDGNSMILNQQQIVKFSPQFNAINNCTIIDFNSIKATLKSPNFNFQIHLIENKSNKNEIKPKNIAEKQPDRASVSDTITKPMKDELLEDLECLICTEYMTPPIFVCKTGHSICNKCKKRIQQCPTCKASYEGTRNLALEKLTEYVSYPCRNKAYGCKIVDKLANLRIHQKDCMQITCPLYNLDNCTYKGSIATIYQHYQQQHPQRLFDLNREISRNVKISPVRDLYLVKYDDKLFNITIDHGLCSMVLWTVEQMDLIDENFKYKFIVDFIDKTNHGRTLTISGLCQSPQQNDPFANTSIKLPDYLLKPFMDKNDVLFFKLDIRKM